MRAMAFHVEIRDGMQRARVFNLDADELRARVLVPFARGGVLVLAEQEWTVADSQLQVLEGPRLEPPDLALGRGWGRAQRTARNVTQELFAALRAAPQAPAALAVLAADVAHQAAAVELLGGLGARVVPWSQVREQVLTGPRGDLAGVAVLLVAEEPVPASWLLDAGLAIGALGGRAVLARPAGARPPVELAGLDVIALDGSEEAAAEVARRLGVPVVPNLRTSVRTRLD
jgi:hypothetical protein